MYKGMAWEPYFRAVEAIMDELDGRPHWGKRHFQTAATLRARYPDWDASKRFAAAGPEGRFANAWTDRVLGPVDRMSERRMRDALERATARRCSCAVRARRPRRDVSERRRHGTPRRAQADPAR